jgi:hypothetical protein
MSFPDYPDYLITTDPRSPHYDDSKDDLYDMSTEQLITEIAEIEAHLVEEKKTWENAHIYERLSTAQRLVHERKRAGKAVLA